MTGAQRVYKDPLNARNVLVRQPSSCTACRSEPYGRTERQADSLQRDAPQSVPTGLGHGPGNTTAQEAPGDACKTQNKNQNNSSRKQICLYKLQAAEPPDLLQVDCCTAVRRSISSAGMCLSTGRMKLRIRIPPPLVVPHPREDGPPPPLGDGHQVTVTHPPPGGPHYHSTRTFAGTEIAA